MTKEQRQDISLIVGGTSGLGLELANLLTVRNNVIYITGRNNPENQALSFVYFDICPHTDQLSRKIDSIFSNLPQPIDLIVYAAGFCQEGSIGQLSDDDIKKMMNVGLITPTLILNKALNRQGKLPGFIAITSTSQWTPSAYEPIYTATKAGLGMLANSLSLDPQVGKVLVAAPGGMKTNFWRNTEEDTTTMLDPKWVAEQISQLYFDSEFKYKYARILRNPPRVEVVEER